jgi:hypothetical protein
LVVLDCFVGFEIVVMRSDWFQDCNSNESIIKLKPAAQFRWD